MGTYEDFKRQIEEATAEIKEEYLAEFQTILDQIEELAEQTSTNTDTVVTIRNDIVNTYLPQMLQTLDSTSDNATLAESYAHGGTGTREGEDTDNAEYYYQQILKYPIKSANNLTTTEEGYVLDARQGKVLDDKIAETSLEWKKAIVGTSSWPDFSSVSGTKYVAAIPSSDYVAGGIYLIKLHNGSIHKVIARAISNEQYGVKNGVVIIGDDVATATASGIQEDTTTGKKAWVTGSTAGYTSTNFAPLVISTSNSVTAWYCKLDWTVEDIISSSSAITDTGQYALDATEKNASIEGTLANQISVLNTNLSNKANYIGTLPCYTFPKGSLGNITNDSFENIKILREFSSEYFNMGSIIHIEKASGGGACDTFFIGSTNPNYFKILCISFYEPPYCANYYMTSGWSEKFVFS